MKEVASSRIVETAWSEGRQPTAGLDQLGIRTNSIRMYEHLLPGITNVTNRVRYYSMHAWFANWWAKNVTNDDAKAFSNKLRVFECIVGMAERIRGEDSGEDFPAITGSDTFRNWLNDNGGPKASSKVPFDELAKRYWKHRGGGFGQYYRGSADALGFLKEDGGVIGLTPTLGLPLAEAFQEAVAGTDLERMLRDESGTVGQLRKLVEASTFQHVRGKEAAILKKSLFDEENQFGGAGQRRRLSLLAVLSLSRQSKDGVADNPIWDLLNAAMHGRTGSNSQYIAPAVLVEHLQLWRTYAYQEFLASALETLFSVAVEEIGGDELSTGYSSISEVADALAKQLPKHLATKRWGQLVQESTAAWTLPSLTAADDPFDEAMLRSEGVNEVWSNGPLALERALLLLARVAAQVGTKPYAGFSQGKLELMERRINLRDWAKTSSESADDACRDVLARAAAQALCAHLRLAGIKLVYTRVYTYKVAFFEGRLTRVEGMWPALSQPRLEQATRMLTDLGLLKAKGDRRLISAEGERVLERWGCA